MKTKSWVTSALRVVACLLLSGMAVWSLGAKPSRATEGEKAVWDLEHDYWRYVQNGDLTSYRGLWHKDFLGWPSVSVAPVRKEHITDWITAQTSKGLTLKSIEFKPAAIQMSGDLAVVCYWMTSAWVDANGAGQPRTTRIIHTWVKNGKDWQIIGGMSMPKPDGE
jgi:ketosteroid isomerase-like protein